MRREQIKRSFHLFFLTHKKITPYCFLRLREAVKNKSIRIPNNSFYSYYFVQKIVQLVQKLVSFTGKHLGSSKDSHEQAQLQFNVKKRFSCVKIQAD